MFYIYIIKSSHTNKIYIGCTSNLQNRIYEHNAGKVFSTKNKCPWQLVYYEAYSAEIDAWQREKQLKRHGKALGQLKRRIGVCLSQINQKVRGSPVWKFKTANTRVLRMASAIFE